jgi:hypothetical protein
MARQGRPENETEQPDHSASLGDSIAFNSDKVIGTHSYDVIAAIECLYYLTPDDQEAFFEKVACERRGKPLILSGPIIGSNEFRKYFTDQSLRKTFARHGLSVMASHNLNVYRRGVMATLAAGLVRLPLCSWLLDYLPRGVIYQRLYAVESGRSAPARSAS